MKFKALYKYNDSNYVELIYPMFQRTLVRFRFLKPNELNLNVRINNG